MRKKNRYALSIFTKRNSQKAVGMLIENYLSIFGKSMDSFLSHHDHLISIDNFNSDETFRSDSFGITQF